MKGKIVASILPLILAACVNQGSPPPSTTAPSSASSAIDPSDRATLDQAFVTWCGKQHGSTEIGCACMPGAMKSQGMSDDELRGWLLQVGAIQGQQPAFLQGRSDALAAALKQCGLS